MRDGAGVRILGLDPGLRATGFGVLDRRGPRLAHVASGCVRPTGTDLPERLKSLFEGVAEVIAAQVSRVVTAAPARRSTRKARVAPHIIPVRMKP